jgi:hypothetical protein
MRAAMQGIALETLEVKVESKSDARDLVGILDAPGAAHEAMPARNSQRRRFIAGSAPAASTFCRSSRRKIRPIFSGPLHGR